MPGQGITVSIQAKIEGWQEQIKQIQSAMKNIKPGTEISKGLAKELQQVETLVNNLSKNMNQRLTSDSQITNFVDKLMDVERGFDRIGTSMSKVSFGDIKPEYITAGFKELLSTLEQANNALGSGMETSFQNAIASSKNLQKEFARMKIDPKSMNIDQIREALAERGKSLEKDVNDGLKKLTDFEKGLEKLKKTRDDLAARDKFLGKDAQATVQSLLVGHQLPTKGTILDSDELERQLSFFRSNLLKAGFTPTQLGHIIPDLESVMKAGHWDEMPTKFANYLREAQNRTKNSLEKASQDYRDAILQHQRMAGAQSHLSSLRFSNTQAQEEVGRILSTTVQSDTKSLRDIVNNLRAQLESKVTSGFHGLGDKLFGASQQGIQDASAAMKDYTAALDQVKAKEQAVGKVQGVVQRYFSIYAAVRMVSKAIRSMMNNIKELDKTITEIAIVTKMDQNDLWGQMPQYTKLAKNYAASISGVYKVSQLYYQQGLGQQDVMALTEQTLKMARISGLDYAEATDYMTNAVRSFKMEMTEASTVVDVYSAVAASSASSVTELATAMSKTASSAAAVGSSFENTTAMLAVMIEATRESPENIGSAMKSIISRYGELKENKTGIDEEGEEYSLNKVDKALQTVGISIHDAQGEFRDFDDVIMELAEKWNTIDKNTQRYIATVMAGNRQQSRFLALVSSVDRLREESEKAANSEDASQLQFLKTMDSIEAKTQQFQTSMQSLYTSSGLEKLYKGLLDFGNEFANTLENISGKQGLVGVISNLGASFVNMATFATTGFSMIKSGFMSTRKSIEYEARQAGLKSKEDDAWAAYNSFKPYTGTNKKKIHESDEQQAAKLAAAQQATSERKAHDEEEAIRSAKLKKQNAKMGWGMAASAAGMALSTWANTIDINKNRGLKGGLTMGSSALQGLGTGLMVGASVGSPLGALVGGLTALPGIIQGIGMLSESVTERVQKLEKNVTEAKNEKIKSKDELKTLEEYKKKYDELSKSQYESAEKKKEFLELSNTIAASYPELIKSMDAEGNYILNMAEGYERLATAKRNAYKEDLVKEMGAEVAGLSDLSYVLKNIYGHESLESKKTLLGTDQDLYNKLLDIDYSKQVSLDQVKGILKENKNVGALTNSVFTARRMFGEGEQISDWSLDISNTKGVKNLTAAGLGASKVTDETAEVISQIYLDFLNEIKQKKDIGGAKEALLEKYKKSAPELTSLISGFDPKLYEEMQLRFNVPTHQKQLIHNSMMGYASEYINLIAESSDQMFSTQSTNLQKRLIKQNLITDWDKWYEENGEAYNAASAEDQKVMLENFFKAREQFWYNQQLESEELAGLGEVENEFFESFGKHTFKDIAQLFSERKSTEGLTGEALQEAEKFNQIQELRQELFEKIFNEDYESILTTYQSWVNKNKDNGILDFSEKIGVEYLPKLQAQYNDILNNTSLSDTQRQAQISSLNNLYDMVSTNENLTFNQKNGILDNFISGDLTTVTGINKAIKYIQGLDLGDIGDSIISNLKDVESNLNINFLTEFSNFSSEIVKQSQDFEKAISNATKGMDLKTAAEMAEKLGTTLQDFSYKDGKYYYEDLSEIDKAYLSYDDQLLESLTERKDATVKMLQGFSLTNIKEQKFDTNRIDEEGYLNDWQEELKESGYLIENGVLKATHEEIISQTKEFFDQFKVDEEGYLDDWDEALGTVGLSADEYRKILATGDLDKIREELTYRVQNLSRIVKDVNVTSADIDSKDFSTLQNLSKEENLGIETLIEQYGNNVEEVVKAISSDDFVTPTNINKTSLIGYVEAFMSRTGEDLDLGWDAWIEKYLNDIYEANKTVIDEYRQDQAARTYLSNGRIKEFLSTTDSLVTAGQMREKISASTENQVRSRYGVSTQAEQELDRIAQELADEENNAIISAIASGDASKLSAELQEKYAKLIYDTYASIQKNVTDAMFEAAEGGQTSIWADEKNVDILQEFTNKGWIKKQYDENGKELNVTKGKQYKFDTEALKKDEENFKKWVADNKKLTDDERAAYLEKYFNIKYPKAKLRESTLSMAEKTRFTYNDIQSYMNDLGVKEGTDVEAWAKANGLDINDLGEFFISSQEIWDKFLDDNLGADDGSKEYRQMKAKLESIRRTSKNETKINTADAVSNLLKDTQTISEKSREALAEAIGDKDAAKYFKDNLDGTYTLDTAQLRQDVEDGTLKIYGEAKESILEGFASLGDEAISAVVNATQLITSGTNKQADMQKIVNAFNGKYSQGQLFKYDDILNAYTFNPAYLQEYQQIQAKEYAKAMNVTEDRALSEVRKQTQETLAAQVDIDSFLKSENRGEGSKAREKLKKQLTDLYLAEMPDNLPEYAQKTYKDAAGLSAETSIKILEAGGQDAVEKAKELAEKADKELSSEEIESYFYSEVNRIKGYADSLTDLTTGQYVAEGDFKNILRSVGMIDSSGMVANIENMAAAYKAIYDKMGETGESTAAQLNEVYAKYLTESERGDIDAIAAMGDAMGMTYETLGQILGREGTKLEDWMNNAANQDMYEKIGAGKVRITDFTKFAAQRGWEPGSEEYTSAFKSYNDSMIELNKKAKTSIQEEVSALESAKGGDQLNLTELYTKLATSLIPTDKIDAALKSNGAELVNGILTLSDNANLIGIAQTLKTAAEAAGSEMSAELQDMFLNVIKAYTEAITKGIEGGMSQVEAQDLTNKALSLGVTDLRFDTTADGLKLAQDSAIELYNTIKKIDALQGRVVFDKLAESLAENNENFTTTTEILSHIREINQELLTASGRRASALKQELEVAKEIVATRAGAEDQSYNFMSGDIPGGQKNMLTYARNWSQALQTIRDAYKVKGKTQKGEVTTGFISYENYYNIINELNRMAGMTGQALTIGNRIGEDAVKLDGTLESASKAIQQGIDNLGAVDSGDVMVNIGALGINLAKGGSNLENSVDKGVQAIANSEMAALDGMIRVLELIVAMESLGDVAGEDMTIELPEIVFDSSNQAAGQFKGAYEYTGKYIQFVKDFNKQLESSPDLKKAAENFKVEGKSINDIINMTADQFMENADLNTALLNAFYQASQSGNWDINNVAASLQEQLNQHFGDIQDKISIDVDGARLMIKNGLVVTVADWTDEDTKKIVEQYKKGKKGKDGQPMTDAEAQAEIGDVIQDYLNGKGVSNQITIEQILKIRHKLNIQKDKDGEYLLGPDNKKYRPDTNGWNALVQKAILQDQDGIDAGDIKVDLQGGTSTVNANLNNKINYTVKADSKTGKVTWEAEYLSQKVTATNQEDFYTQLYRVYSEEFDKDPDNKNKELPTKKQFLNQEFDIHYKINTKIAKDGVEIDTDSAEGQKKIREALENLPNELDTNGEGNYEIPLGDGTVITLDPSDVEINGKYDKDAAKNALLKALGLDTALQETITNAIKDALQDLPGLFETIANGPAEGADSKWDGVFTAIGTGASNAAEKVQDLINKLKELNPQGGSPGETPPGGTTPTESPKPIVKPGLTANKPTDIPQQYTDTGTGGITIPTKIEEPDTTAIDNLNPSIEISVTTSPTIDSLNAKLSESVEKTVFVTQKPREYTGNAPVNMTKVKGTFGAAFATGTPTLMGELGPELVVSGGRYYVVGQSGAEMVNLAQDAIVFNHLQTRSLLNNGHATRGQAVINERKATSAATSMAKGNIHGGPAMSSASAALAALKQLRSQWQALANLSAQDLAGAGGGGGGGGGKDAAFIKELERWYNYLQKIAQLEKEINFEEAKRNRIKSQSNRSGADYYKSQKESLKDLKEESETYRKLATEQQAYFNKRRDEMNKKSNPFTSLYTFDENGQLKYKPGAFEKLSKISGRDNSGKPNKTPKQQYDAIVKMNPKFKEFMKYDSSGNKIEYKNGKPKDDAAYQAAIQAFWDKIEADKQEMQSLHDSIEDAKVKQEELDTKRNELLQEMKDNQMSVEDKVLKAIEDQRQRAIDKLSDERNALEKSTGKYIQGLSDALNKEREMYEKSDSADELNRLMRQLDILKRSGGSASEIRDIEGQIREKQRDAYFDAQQEQIDKVQEASDLQLERLDTQIEIMTEALEYQKQMGLLWDEVYQVMSGSAEDITAFIMGNTTEFWEKSPLALEQETQQTFFEADQWEAYREDLDVIAEGAGTDTPEEKPKTNNNNNNNDGSFSDADSNRKKYKVTYTDKKGKEQTKTFKTKKEATEYQKSIEKDKKNKKGTKVTVTTLSYFVYAFKKGWKKGDSAKEFGPYTKADANKKKTSLESNASYAYKTTKKKIKVAKSRPKGYSEGGYDYDTGLAMLHGTPAKPEAVLNAAQTKVLRDNILSKKPNSLLSLLEAYNEAYKDGIGTITNNEGITIENATVNMNVQQIANDYDAQRAGEQALAEMLRIARKTSAANSVRR